jgi:hypothetical protein
MNSSNISIHEDIVAAAADNDDWILPYLTIFSTV